MENNEINNQEFHLRINWNFVILIIALIFVALSFQFFYHPKLVTPDGNFPVAPDIPKDMKESPINEVQNSQGQIPSTATEINTYKVGELPDDLKGFFDDKVVLPK
jgi:hypothetical protein